MAEPTTKEQARARRAVGECSAHGAPTDGCAVCATLSAQVAQVSTVLAEQREEYERALWVCGAFVEIYEGQALDKPRADALLRELGIRRWPDGSVNNPSAITRSPGV